MAVPPPGYRFVHNLPNKPLTGYRFCRILKTKEIVFKIFKTLELWSVWSFGRHKPVAGGFCLDSSLIIRGLSSSGPSFCREGNSVDGNLEGTDVVGRGVEDAKAE